MFAKAVTPVKPVSLCRYVPLVATNPSTRCFRSKTQRDLVVANSDAAAAMPSGEGAPDIPASAEKKSIGTRIKQFFIGDPSEKNKLAAIGMAAFLSYGFVSNVTYGVCLSVSWHSFMKVKGVCPLDPGQWPAFLAFYAGVWAVQNVFRPARFALAVAMAPIFDRGINFVALTLNVSKKIAFGLCLGLMSVLMTVCLFSGIYFPGGE
eukprot:gene24893-10558_t